MSINVKKRVDGAPLIVHKAHMQGKKAPQVAVTIHQIRKQMRPHKRVSERQTRRYLEEFDIQPVGARKRPQLYPGNAALVILHNLGLCEAEELAR